MILMNWKPVLEINQDGVQQRRSAGLYSAVGVIMSGWASLKNIPPACST